MKTLNLVIALLAFNLFTTAQPVLTAADFPIGQNIHYVSRNPSFSSFNSATPFNVTVSALQTSPFDSVVKSIPIAEVPNSENFPTATSAIKYTNNFNGQINYELYETTALTHKLIAAGNNSLTLYNSLIFTFPVVLNSLSDYYGTYVSYGTIATPSENYDNVIRFYSNQNVDGYTIQKTTYAATNPYRVLYVRYTSIGHSFSEYNDFFEYLPYSLSDEKFSSNFYSISPNPTSGDFRISTDNYESAGLFVTVYDLLGKIVIPTQPITTEIQTVNSNALSAGLYIVKVSDKNNQVIKTDKIIKI